MHNTLWQNTHFGSKIHLFAKYCWSTDFNFYAKILRNYLILEAKMYELFEFSCLKSWFSEFRTWKTTYSGQFRRQNSNFLGLFFPSKIINFFSKIQIDFLVSNLSNGIFEPEMDLWHTVQCNLLQVRSVKYWKLWQLKMLGRDTNSSFV